VIASGAWLASRGFVRCAAVDPTSLRCAGRVQVQLTTHQPTMDVEMFEAAQAGPSNSSGSSSQTKARALSPVIVPAESPFELDSYAALYKSALVALGLG